MKLFIWLMHMYELEMIGKRLEDERKRLGMTAVEVYQSLDIAQTTYKNGDELDLELFERLARQHNWRDTAINFVITKTNHVAEGGNVQLKNNKETGANIYQKIIDETS